MQTIWKDIPSFEGYYQASNCGDIRSIDRMIYNGKNYFLKKGVLLKQRNNKKGYRVVDLSINQKSLYRLVHRLVAQTFIPNINNKPQINHIDGNKTNNCVTNLEWCDNAENQRHAYKLGLNKRADNAGRLKRAVELFDKKGNKVKEFSSIAETVRWLDCANSNVKLCCDNKRKTVKGFIAKYKGVM